MNRRVIRHALEPCPQVADGADRRFVVLLIAHATHRPTLDEELTVPFVSRWANSYSSTLAAAVTDTTGATLTVASAVGLPSLTVPSGAIPAVVAILVDNEIMHVTGISGTTLTVLRGQDSTTAATHTSGATVTAVVTRDTLYNNSAAGAIRTTLATGSNVTYTPDMTYKYHFLYLPTTAITSWTIANPAAGPISLQAGDEFRLWIKQPATGMTTAVPTWGTVYDRIQTGGTTQRTVATTANSVTSFSFAWDGVGTAPGAAGSWHLIS